MKIRELNGILTKVRGLKLTKLKLEDWLEFLSKLKSVICSLDSNIINKTHY